MGFLQKSKESLTKIESLLRKEIIVPVIGLLVIGAITLLCGIPTLFPFLGHPSHGIYTKDASLQIGPNSVEITAWADPNAPSLEYAVMGFGPNDEVLVSMDVKVGANGYLAFNWGQP